MWARGSRSEPAAYVGSQPYLRRAISRPWTARKHTDLRSAAPTRRPLEHHCCRPCNHFQRRRHCPKSRRFRPPYKSLSKRGQHWFEIVAALHARVGDPLSAPWRSSSACSAALRSSLRLLPRATADGLERFFDPACRLIARLAGGDLCAGLHRAAAGHASSSLRRIWPPSWRSAPSASSRPSPATPPSRGCSRRATPSSSSSRTSASPTPARRRRRRIPSRRRSRLARRRRARRRGGAPRPPRRLLAVRQPARDDARLLLARDDAHGARRQDVAPPVPHLLARDARRVRRHRRGERRRRHGGARELHGGGRRGPAAQPSDGTDRPHLRVPALSLPRAAAAARRADLRHRAARERSRRC